MRLFSLRAHTAPVVAFCVVGESPVSGDASGDIVVWDMRTRRPRHRWKAHHGHIYTLKAVDDGLLSHGRDNAVRIWNLHDLGTATFEMPVNSLNFCNVDFCNHLLATPGTQNSENFDIYRIRGQELSRVVADFGGEVSSELSQRGGNGTVMRLLFVDDSLLFVGYESGVVRGYRIDFPVAKKIHKANDAFVLNKDAHVTVVFESELQKPHPVLSLERDVEQNCIFAGSASLKLLKIDLSGLDADIRTPNLNVSVFNTGHHGAQAMSCSESHLAVGFWDGTVQVYDGNMNVVSTTERAREQMRPDDLAVQLAVAVMYTAACSGGRVLARKMPPSLLFVGHSDGLIRVHGPDETEKIAARIGG